MFTPHLLAARQKLFLSSEQVQVQTRRPVLASLTLLLYLGMMLPVLGVVVTARAEPAPELLDLDLPQAYLPGSPMPEDVLCYSYLPYKNPVRCAVNYRGNEINLIFDADMKTILRATIPTQEFAVAKLITTWGTPTGIIQTSGTTYVYWGARSAHLYTDSFRPDSRVEFIQYDLEPQRTSPWRGFRRYRN